MFTSGSTRQQHTHHARRLLSAVVPIGRSLMVWALLLTLASPRPTDAIEASPHAFEAVQPDGHVVRLHIRGDEHFHWLEDPHGYTVMRDAKRYVYANLDAKGALVPTALLVGRANPGAAGLAKRLLPSPANRRQNDVSILTPDLVAPEAPDTVSPSGTINNIVILMRFSNHRTRTLPSNADFFKIFNAAGGDPVLAPTGSVRDLYYENSYGAMILNSTVFGWVDLPNTESYYADGQSGTTTKVWEAVIAALNTLDPQIDFRSFDRNNDGFVDSIAFVHSGYGAEWGGVDASGTDYRSRIWSHKWSIPTWTSAEGVKVSPYHINPGLWGTSGTEPGRIGVIAHETGHFFGLPDLYDTNGGGEGIGSYCLMANSWGFTGDQRNPPHLSAWSKIALGWVAPTSISAAGTYFAPQVETNRTVFRIDAGFPTGEYLLIENRQPVGFERTMPQGGLAIWHIDEAKAGNTDQGYPGQAGWPGNNQHYKVALLQADGAYHLEKGFNRGDGGDVYHANGTSAIGPTTVPNTNAYQSGIVRVTDNRISSISASAATMSFHYQRGAACAYSISPTSQSVGASGATGSVSVSTASGCAWTAASNVSWITITSGSSGSGSGTVAYSVASNGTTSSRTGTLSIAGQTFTVTQAAASSSTPLSSGVPYNDAVAGTTSQAGWKYYHIDVVAGADSLIVDLYNLTADADLYVRYGATPTLSAYDCRPYFGGSASEQCRFTAPAQGRWWIGVNNYDVGTISYTVKATTVTPTPCTYAISPSGASFGSAGGSGTIAVTTGSGCRWTASSYAGWITITAGGSGSGNGTVTYAVASNGRKRSRTGYIDIAGKTFTVTQAGR